MPTQIRRVRMLWEWLYRSIGGGGFVVCDEVDDQWPAGLQEPVYGRMHRMLMRLDLSDWAERRAYFAGAYYQWEIEYLLRMLLAQGDQFVDVGANIGMTALIAASRIGKSGRAWAFEPNPLPCARLRAHLAENRIENFTIIPAALGRVEGVGALSMCGPHTGQGTLTSVEGAVSAIQVRILPGRFLNSELNPSIPTVIKIDVEGFEYEVLSGMGELLSRSDVAIVMEITDHLLRRAGASAEGIYGLLRDSGFDAYKIGSRQDRWSRSCTLLRHYSPLQIEQYDAMFLKRASATFCSRVGSIVEGGNV
jgi:FkbM family methyltransferase